MTFLPGVSIIVCCYNSSFKLSNTLKNIALQKFVTDVSWEVIVVDNNSTDNTAGRAEEIWKGLGKATSFSVIKESKPGLSFARKAGAEKARYEFLLFCDDDNWLDENYVYHAYEIMLNNKNIGILGGKSTGYFDLERPQWFDKFADAYAVGSPLKTSGIANTRTFVAGAGMVIRKSILKTLDDLSYKQVLTDRKGNQLSSGGDVELCLAVLFLGYDLYYDERLKFIHYITKNRLEWSYCVKMISKGQAIPQIYLQFYHYCTNKLSAKDQINFEEIYFSLQKKLLDKLRQLVSTNTPYYTAKLLLKSQPGSRKEIETKTNLNKLIYLLKNKKVLKMEFESIYAQLIKINQLKQDRVLL